MVIRFLLATAWLFCCLNARPQTIEFYDVNRLPGVVNSAAEEGMPLLSMDGKRLFFSRSLFKGNEGGFYGGQDIWMAERLKSGWSKASNTFASLNNKKNNVIVGISKDGKTFYYVDGGRAQKMNGINFVRQQQGSEFSHTQTLYIPGIDNLDFIGFYVSPDADVIFLSMKSSDSRGNEDLYYSLKDDAGSWSKPKNLGATINTEGFEISPFLSPDKRRLYFASNGHKGLGDADIFFSERLYDSWETWSVPVNLGPVVNSKKFDAYFSTYGDTVAFFSSNRDGQYADIFQVKMKQAKTILEKDQHYLSAEEWAGVVGKNVSNEFAFPHNSTILSSGQKELVFYIVNKLMLERDIRFHLVIKEEEDPAISKERLGVLAKELNAAGIDPVRVKTEQVRNADRTQRGVIELKLFR